MAFVYQDRYESHVEERMKEFSQTLSEKELSAIRGTGGIPPWLRWDEICRWRAGMLHATITGARPNSKGCRMYSGRRTCAASGRRPKKRSIPNHC